MPKPEMPHKVKTTVNKLGRTGFFQIVGAGLINKVISFLSGVILVRVLSKGDYGAYSYALNIINYFLLLNGLGTAGCVVQLCVEQGEANGKAELAYHITSAIGMIWDTALTIAIVLTALFVPLPIFAANFLLLLLSPLPLFSLATAFQQQRLRSKFLNKEFSLGTNLNTFAIATFSVGGAMLGSSVGLSLGRSLAMAVSAIVVRIVYNVKVYFKPPGVKRETVLDVLKMSLTVCLTNAVSQVLILSGTTLVGVITGDQEAVASYAVATTIPFALLFLPSMVMGYATPYFIQNSHDRAWVFKKSAMCSAGVGLVSLVVAAACIVGSSWIIPIVFGEQYTLSIFSFRVLMVAFVISSTFRAISANVLATHRKYGFNFASSAAALVTAITATSVLVPTMGIAGAAVGYALAVSVDSAISMVGLLIFAGRPVKPKAL